MKKVTLFLIVVLQSLAMTASDLLPSLMEINKRWAYETDLPDVVFEEYQKTSNNELIQTHLFLVHQVLSERSTDGLSEAQKSERKQHLDVLLQYAKRGLFPVNDFYSGVRPVFIDPIGTHCAVGFLIKESGNGWLAESISRNMNYEYVLNMKDDNLVAWQQSSGFTVEELAWIQPGYPHTLSWTTYDGGTSGRVNDIAMSPSGHINIGGLFDSAGVSNIENLSQYVCGIASCNWTPLAFSHPNGEIHDVEFHNGELYIAGTFYGIDSIYSNSGVAKWDGSKWVSLGDFYIGALMNTVYELEFYRDTLYAGGFFRSAFGAPEMFTNLAKWDGTQWRGLGMSPQGVVKAMTVYDDKLIVGGSFESVGNATSVATVNHVLYVDSSGIHNMAMGVPTYINALEVMNDTLYAAGDLLSPNQQDTGGFFSWSGGNWQNLMQDGLIYNKAGKGFYAMQSTPYGMVLGGDFSMAVPFTYGKNLMRYNHGGFYALGIVDSTVRALEVSGNMLLLGGDFEVGLGPGGNNQPLNHIAGIDMAVNVSTPEYERERFEFFPNPASRKITVEFNREPIRDVQIINMAGQYVEARFDETGNGIEVDVSRLKPGSYILELSGRDHVIGREVLLIE